MHGMCEGVAGTFYHILWIVGKLRIRNVYNKGLRAQMKQSTRLSKYCEDPHCNIEAVQSMFPSTSQWSSNNRPSMTKQQKDPLDSVRANIQDSSNVAGFEIGRHDHHCLFHRLVDVTLISVYLHSWE
jgi:hypothetical protein